jgi:hypothetical protein
MSSTVETRRRHWDPLANKFKDDNEKRRYFTSIGAKGNRERLVLSGHDVAGLAKSTQALAQSSQRSAPFSQELVEAYAFLLDIGRRAKAKLEAAKRFDAQEGEDVA